MAFTEEDKEKMDLAAKEAEKDFENLSAKSVEEVASWWKKHYAKAGHKRLGRILLQNSKS
jgi:CRISPR/Cas system CSM-associated protein Csm5 (group 7 of RAMP superfamily)